jgi:hypothetical protein
MFKKLLLGITMLLLLTGSALAQTGEDVGFAWALPDSGNAVDHFVVEMATNGGTYMFVADVDTNYYGFFAEAINTYTLRVLAVDASGGQSIYSEPSDLLQIDFGPPTQPGKPYRVQ